MVTQLRLRVVMAFVAGVSALSGAHAQPYATARYDASNGVMYVYETAQIGVLGFLAENLLSYSEGYPRLGGVAMAAGDNSVFFWASGNPPGLPAGLFSLRPTPFPAGLAPTQIESSYSAYGMSDVQGIVETFDPTPAASAVYNRATGNLLVNVGPTTKALLLESSGLFDLSAAPFVGSLAPSQFDSSNLMFFNNDAPLPAGTFDLGPVLPPGLDASQISLATKGNGIAVGIPVRVVPEPATGLVALLASAAAAAKRAGARPRGSRSFVRV